MVVVLPRAEPSHELTFSSFIFGALRIVSGYFSLLKAGRLPSGAHSSLLLPHPRAFSDRNISAANKRRSRLPPLSPTHIVIIFFSQSL